MAGLNTKTQVMWKPSERPPRTECKAIPSAYSMRRKEERRKNACRKKELQVEGEGWYKKITAEGE
jgi:hypothetical protein